MSRYQPALLGGLFIGVLSSLPVVNIANCCCLWVIVGGGLTTYLLQQSRPDPVEPAEAALQGALAPLQKMLPVPTIPTTQEDSRR